MKELAVSLQINSKIPLYEQIYNSIRVSILNGKILKDEKLPSTRFQAEYLQVSRSTVEAAYAQLLSEGYIYSKPYRGYFVCDVRELYRLSGLGREQTDVGTAGSGQKETDAGHEQGVRKQKPEIWIDFSPNGIETEQFPYDSFARILRNEMLDAREALLDTGPSFGDPGLRRQICDYLYRSRSVNCAPEQIILGAGNEYLEILLAQILGKSRCAAMESPTYLQAYKTFRSIGYSVAEIGMDVNGMRCDELTASGADLVYVMPSHQFPLGTVMPLKRRLELLSWAREKEERYIIEDDYDSEFRYRGKPIPALQGMDRDGKVIYIGTFSRSIAPSVRISYMVLPEQLVHEYQKRCGFYSCTVSNIMQKAISRFLREGLFEKNLNRMRRIYRTKHDFLLEELQHESGVLRVFGENAGLHLLAEINSSQTEEELVAQCRAAGVRVYGITDYYISRKSAFEKPVLLMGYGGLTNAQMRRGLDLIFKNLL